MALHPFLYAAPRVVSPPRFNDKEVAEILDADAEPDIPNVDRAKITPYWFETPGGKQPEAKWPDDKLAYDYAHLTPFPRSDDKFEVSFDALTRYAKLAHYELESDAIFLFGLRGCMLASGKQSTAFASNHQVVEAVPDHVHPRCLIGVANVRTGMIALFSASTVPCSEHMERQIKNQSGCNLMPTGLHHYYVGAHTGINQRGAFKQKRSLWVRRAKQSPIYSLVDRGNEWDDNEGAIPADNIHAAMLSYRSKPPFFSSAGCQVVVGAYSRETRMPVGPWDAFRRAAGLADLLPNPKRLDISSSDDGKAFKYMLLTGREAALMARGQDAAVRSIRYGSSGEAVLALQTFLQSKALLAADKSSRVMDRATFGAWLRYQVEQKTPTSGILSVGAAKDLGIEL